MKDVKKIETPYAGIDKESYHVEKRRLQVELLKIQQHVVKNQQRMAVVFEGRDAAGKGSTIKRFVENLMPRHYKIVALGIPNAVDKKYWFRRYERELPKSGEIAFFDRSWYNRALIEPTMGYCNEAQYKYFMNKVLDWEHKQQENGLILVKFYLSITSDSQLYRFEDRLSDPLTFWKFSENDLHARERWETFTHFKEQMFNHTSSRRSPWVVINADEKRATRLTAMLYLVQLLGDGSFMPLSGEESKKTYAVKLDGVKFSNLTFRQYAVLKARKRQQKIEDENNAP